MASEAEQVVSEAASTPVGVAAGLLSACRDSGRVENVWGNIDLAPSPRKVGAASPLLIYPNARPKAYLSLSSEPV